jgi:chromosome segregation ATPase
VSQREQNILAAIEQAERIRGQVFEADQSLEAIEAARRQLSSAQDELRGQHTAIKARVAWLIRELDELTAKFKCLARDS